MTSNSSSTSTPESFFRHRGADARDGGHSTPGIEPDRVLGDFRLVRKLGEGNMGQVWEAVQISLDRLVALKLMPSGRLLSETALAMFEREAKAGGRLHHPSIVSVLAYGVTDGIPYIAQELIGDGWSLKDVIQKERLARELAEDRYSRIATFFADAATALQVAHDAGVVHRDLKPANILVVEDDRPMIADFGLAKVSGVEPISRTGELAGTYCYMSPEQVLAKRIGLDHRSDIFSLGTTLYEALTLQRPFDGDTGLQVTEAIVYAEPEEPRSIRSKIPRDLAVICLKAMEKRRKDRYASMAEFSSDIRRYLANEPIMARPAGRLLRAAKWVRRHPTKSVALGLTAVALVAITALAWWQYETAGELKSALTETEAQRDRADANAARGQENAKLAEQQRRKAEAQRDVATRRSWLAVASDAFPDDAAGRAMILREAPPEAEVDATFVRLAIGWAHGEFHRVFTLRGHVGPVSEAAWSQDGTRIVTASADGTARVWNADGTGEPLVLRGHEENVNSAAWSPDGARVVTASADRTARVWNADGRGEPRILRGHEDAVNSAEWSPDGIRIVTVSDDGTARIWNVDGASDPLVLRRHASDVNSAAWSPDGTRIVTTSDDGVARVWNVTWRGVRERLWNVIDDLLSPQDRVQYLGESESVARAAYALQKVERDARVLARNVR